MANQIPQLPPKWVIASINERITINPLTGIMTWKKSFRQMKAGAVVGSPSNKGYIRVRFSKTGSGNKQVLGHQVAWYLYYGEWPKHRIDHEDGNEGNNSKNNLRPATHQQNRHNSKVSSNNKCGHRGIRQFNRKYKDGSVTIGYSVRLYLDGKRYSLGTYSNINLAIKAREKGERKHYKEYSYVESRKSKSRFTFTLRGA